MLKGDYLKLFEILEKFIPSDRLIYDELRKLAYGTDAGFYRLIPNLVVKVETEEEAQKVIIECNKLKLPITFRAAGTSLSGQAISDSVLLILGGDWNKYQILDNGEKIKLQPGVVGAFANLYLAPFHKKLGPDPASINSAKIGGIAANNASGMTSGTAKNIYNTLIGMKIVFSDGTILDTSDKLSRDNFYAKRKDLIDKITTLSQKVKADTKIAERINNKYKMKNTCGYGVNSLIDFEDPFEIISHLMIGSEGTLGFISELTLKTVPELPNKATALIFFEDTKTACMAIPIFNNLPVDAAEIMDRAALRAAQNKPGMPEFIKDLGDQVTALLIETSSMDKETLGKQIDEITKSIDHLPKVQPISFTTNKYEYKKLWDIRKGLFPTVCAARKTGTTVIIEDVNLPTEHLADAVLDLQSLFDKHGYNDTIIWGHAIAGNIHFVFSQDFNSDSEVNRYKYFMEDISKLVVEKYDGSLKAEHGTGRNMAPFVEYEWGTEIYEIMKEIKNIFDPDNLLNPGVIINNDKNIFVKNLKPMPIADPIIDKCIECGFCEVNCPSKELTLSPRQRIVAWREIHRLKYSDEDHERLNTFINSFDYFGNQTCATDGLCATSCPVDINTGNLIKQLRLETSSGTANNIAQTLANHMDLVTWAAKNGLSLVNLFHTVLGTTVMEGISKGLYKIGNHNIPLWNKYMPKGADNIIKIPVKEENPFKVVYFPSCISRSMGPSKYDDTEESQTTVMTRLLQKAGFEIIYPENLNNLCCGMAFASKGFKQQGDAKTEELITALNIASQEGKYPVLYDTSPCMYRTKEFIAIHNNAKFKIYEPIEFIYEVLKDRLKFNKQDKTVTIHTTCSSKKMGLEEKFKELTSLCVSNVIVPAEVGCCGFAGDRGFTYPELNSSALRNLEPSLTNNCNEGYSNSRTCEIGLSVNTGISYKSIIYLVDDVTESI
ncbi:MAG TPA: FAD-binding and (Fe-S)-binding domain-containing protein [Melioribacteraceae bacterium]|nr:FAD-binding and (Fe-S)-binding domain-containing protein [Melioribacteraceae bacterium]